MSVTVDPIEPSNTLWTNTFGQHVGKFGSERFSTLKGTNRESSLACIDSDLVVGRLVTNQRIPFHLSVRRCIFDGKENDKVANNPCWVVVSQWKAPSLFSFWSEQTCSVSIRTLSPEIVQYNADSLTKSISKDTRADVASRWALSKMEPLGRYGNNDGFVYVRRSQWLTAEGIHNIDGTRTH